MNPESHLDNFLQSHYPGPIRMAMITLKSGPTPASFLFIFVLFKHNITEKTVGFREIRTRMVGVEGEYADHLTTTTAQLFPFVDED